MSLSGDELTHLGRTLNLDNGVAAERIEVDGQIVWRAAWASRPAGVLCIALEVEDGGLIDLGLELDSPLRIARRVGAAVGVDIPVDGAPLHKEPDVRSALARYTDEPWCTATTPSPRWRWRSTPTAS